MHEYAQPETEWGSPKAVGHTDLERLIKESERIDDLIAKLAEQLRPVIADNAETTGGSVPREADQTELGKIVTRVGALADRLGVLVHSIRL